MSLPSFNTLYFNWGYDQNPHFTFVLIKLIIFRGLGVKNDNATQNFVLINIEKHYTELNIYLAVEILSYHRQLFEEITALLIVK